MDVERTIEFILEQQAKTEVQMGAIRNLVERGMELVLSIGAAQREADLKITQLAAAQLIAEEKHQASEERHRVLEERHQALEEKFQAFLDWLRHGRNGGGQNAAT
jgi:hypothetical protein